MGRICIVEACGRDYYPDCGLYFTEWNAASRRRGEAAVVLTPRPPLPVPAPGGMAAGGEFVEGWLVAQVLGEGAYGEVRLLVHAGGGAALALKAVRGARGAREAALHRALRHAHVLRCRGQRAHPPLHYLFLEYAQGGELFHRIEPDVGAGTGAARRWWRELLAGLRYLQARGVAHRDIKPENLLLDARDTLKISDFGMATLYRRGARERLLARVCGTAPYCAPEVLRAAAAPYRAAPADLWAAALVLLAMLVGELPWERAEPSDARFAAWSSWATDADAAAPPAGPWGRVPRAALPLLRAALQPDAARRAALPALLRHRWTQEPAESVAREWRSQPTHGEPSVEVPGAELGAAPGAEPGAALSAAAMDALISHSQPAAADDLLLATPAHEAPAGVLQRLVQRMTRMEVACAPGAALAELAAAAARAGHAARRLAPHLLAIECGAELRLRVWALPAGTGALLQFRRWRGCGLRFQRAYRALRAALAHLEPAAPPRT